MSVPSDYPPLTALHLRIKKHGAGFDFIELLFHAHYPFLDRNTFKFIAVDLSQHTNSFCHISLTTAFLWWW
jgi:hypothetical protein